MNSHQDSNQSEYLNQIRQLSETISEKDVQITYLNHQIYLMKGSLSWKITRPLRFAKRLAQNPQEAFIDFLRFTWRNLPVSVREKLQPLKNTVRRKWLLFLRRMKGAIVDITWDEFEASVLSKRKHYKGIFVQDTIVDWSIPLYQRPQHIASALGQLGYLVIFKTLNQLDQVDGFRQIEKNVWITNSDEIDAIDGVVCSVYSTGFFNVDRIVKGKNNNTWCFVYEYIDHINPMISGDAENIKKLTHLRDYAFAGAADFIIASARNLENESKSLFEQEKIFYVPNGVDVKHYRNPSHRHVAIPEKFVDFKARYKIIVGYFGAIAPWLWYEMLAELFELRPDLGFVFIGPDFNYGLEHLPARENVLHLGTVDYKILPAYAHHFDVCFIPFAPGEIAHSTSPLKLFEYFALEKPVVVTSFMDECIGFEEVFSGDTAHSISNAIDKAVSVKDNAKYKARLAHLADQNSWLERAKTFEKIFEAWSQTSISFKSKRESSKESTFLNLESSKHELDITYSKNIGTVKTATQLTIYPNITIAEMPIIQTLANGKSLARSYSINLLGLHPNVSIVIVTYNNLELTKLCLQSIFLNTNTPFEVIVVDNASSDGTPEYLQEISTYNENIRVILNSKNTGFAKANNQGLEISEGKYLVLLNNDTIVPGGWFEKFLPYLCDSTVGMVGPATNGAYNEARVEVNYSTWAEMEAFAQVFSSEHKNKTAELDMLAMFCVAFRRTIYNEIGELDERFGIGMFEDDDYCYRIRQHEYKVICAYDTFVHHFGQASFGKLAQDGTYMKLFEENKKKFEEKWGSEWKKYSLTLEDTQYFAFEKPSVETDIEEKSIKDVQKIIINAYHKDGKQNSYYESTYSAQEPFYWHPIPKWIMEMRCVHSAINIGAAYGTLLIFSALNKETKILHAIDPVEYMSKSLINDFGIVVYSLDFERSELQHNDKFDLVIFTEVIEHLNFHPDSTLKKIKQLMHKDSRLLISTPDASEWGRTTKYYSKLDEIPPYAGQNPKWVDDHIWQYTKEELDNIFIKNGFLIEKFAYAPGVSARHLCYMLKI